MFKFSVIKVKRHGDWYEIYLPEEPASGYANWQKLLDEIKRVEILCFLGKIYGWIVRTKEPNIIRHMETLGAKQYAKKDDMIFFSKQVKESPKRVSLRKHIMEVINA